ncbi:MAG: spore maturation protein A [Provencibacterium sp.]|jgi:spore maturation protein A|nr:spore maturation protein A [Provencibacterium sp.]
MMNYLFVGMIGLSLVFGLLNGRVSQISTAALDGGLSAVKLVISLCGSLCLWSGVMRVAQKSGLTESLGRLMAPVIRPLFRPVTPYSEAGKWICMNMAANLIGLGNAVTPLGIAAMRELEKYNGNRRRATNSMVMFVVLNTASLQIIPTTTAMLRLAAGSSSPMEIVPAVWIASLCSVLSGIMMVWILNPLFPE